MEIFYDKADNEVVITEVEKVRKKNVRHTFKGTPMVLQYHPKKDDEIIRVYFEGKRPNWIKDQSVLYQSDFVSGEGILGWWITTWKIYEGLIITPSLEGAVIMISEAIPEEFPDLKNKIIQNIDIIALNLKYDPNHYNVLGLYYKKESLIGDSGAVYIDPNILFKKGRKEEREDYLQRFMSSGITDLIDELISPIDYDDEFILSQQEMDNESFDEVEEAEAKQVVDDEFETLEDDLEEDTKQSTDLDESELVGEWEDDSLLESELDDVWEEDEISEALIIEDSQEEVPSVITESDTQTEISNVISEIEETSVATETISESNTEVNDDEIYEKLGLKVAETTSRKGDAIAGQLVFF